MGIDDHLPDQLSVGVQKPEPSGPGLRFAKPYPGVSDDHLLAAGVVANVVGVVGELKLAA